MVEFILILLISFQVFLAKYLFYLKESNFNHVIIFLDITSLLFVFTLGILSFLTDLLRKIRKKRAHFPKVKLTYLTVVTCLGIFFFIVLSFYLNLSKRSMEWDALALYDARAKFLTKGINFSQMVALSNYDFFNKYYYLLYPPFTSLIHYFWETSPVLATLPVSVYYSIDFTLLIIFLFSSLRTRLGVIKSLFMCLLIAANLDMFKISVMEYTNMPFTLFLVVSLFLLMRYLDNGSKWQGYFSIFLIASSMWIRFLEPVWLVVIISFTVLTFFTKEFIKYSRFLFLLIIISLIQFFAWVQFTKYAGNPSPVNFTLISLIDAIFGIFTGALLRVSLVLIANWGIEILALFFTIISVILSWKSIKSDIGFMFLFFVLVASVIMYFSEYYFYSFLANDWESVATSVGRSSTYLIPIVVFQLLYLLNHSYLAKK